MILIFIFICLIRGTFLFGPPGETLHDHPPTVRPFPHAPLLRRGAALLIEQMNAEHGDTVMFLARGCTERAICEAVLGTPEPGALPIVCTTLRGTRFRVFLPLPRSLTDAEQLQDVLLVHLRHRRAEVGNHEPLTSAERSGSLAQGRFERLPLLASVQ